MRYFNIKSVYGIETVDELSEKEFNSYKEYRKELIRLLNEYRLIYDNVYTSSRCTNYWKLKK